MTRESARVLNGAGQLHGAGGRCDRGTKGFVDLGTPRAATAFHLRESGLVRHRGTVAPRGGERVVDIHDADDLRREWELVTPQPVRVSGAVQLFMVPPDDRLDVPGKLHAGEQLHAIHRVKL